MFSIAAIDVRCFLAPREDEARAPSDLDWTWRRPAEPSRVTLPLAAQTPANSLIARHFGLAAA